MEGKKENVTPEEECRPNAVRLTDEQLNKIAGGKDVAERDPDDIFDRKGRWIGHYIPGWVDFFEIPTEGFVAFYPCKCGRPMHQGKLGFWYCDPCDRFEVWPCRYLYTGGRAEFIENFCK